MMGWLGKTLTFLLAIILVGVGAWQLSLLIFAVLLIPPLVRVGRRRRRHQSSEKPKGKFAVRPVVAGLFFLLALLGLLAHGEFSPIVFASLGVLVVVWGRVLAMVLGSKLEPVPGSILLRSFPLPFSWSAVAEVKPITRDLGRALAGVTGSVLISTTEKPSIYVVFRSSAFSERSAEASLLGCLKETACSLSALGAYLLPLDSQLAAKVLASRLEGPRIAEGSWSISMSSGSYDLVAIGQEEGFARSLGLYKNLGEGNRGHARLPSQQHEFSHPPLLVEVFKVLGTKIAWPQPDQYTSFLSSLLATSSEPIGTRILDVGAASQAQLVLVKSQSSPSVEVSRAQLRAVVRIYDRDS